MKASGQAELDPGPYRTMIHAYRERWGKTRYALSRASGVDPSYVTRTTKGERVPPSRNIIESLADAMGLPPEDRVTLLESAGWAETPRFRDGDYVVVKALARPVVRCIHCGFEWRALAKGTKPSCPFCLLDEQYERAGRIAAFARKIAIGQVYVPVTERAPTIHKVVVPKGRVAAGDRRCRGCKTTFPESGMVLVRLEGYYCVPCHRAYIDGLMVEVGV